MMNEKEKFKLAFELALLDMPEEFSSKQFCRKLREIGTDEEAIKSGAANRFLTANCKMVNDRSWVKKSDKPIEFMDETDKQRRIDEAIALLKSEGMKVLMPQTKFIEL